MSITDKVERVVRMEWPEFHIDGYVYRTVIQVRGSTESHWRIGDRAPDIIQTQFTEKFDATDARATGLAERALERSIDNHHKIIQAAIEALQAQLAELHDWSPEPAPGRPQ